MNRKRAAKARRWVVKIGSALVTNKGRGLDGEAIRGWSEQVTALRQAGCEVVLVSSGAIAEGLSRLQWSKRPHALFELQAAAAVGQMGLIQAYESCFQRHGLHTAQVLLTHDDLAHRNRYLNARTTLRTLLELGVIPVVNENDTVATEKIKLGDNDNLAALVCNLVEADLLVILTDQQGLYNQDPRLNANARLISEARAGDSEILRMAGPSLGHLGRGGMTTKVQAAQRAARSGTMTVITAGSEPQVLVRIRQGDELGTLLVPDQMPLVARKQWLANQLQVRGELLLDEGASRVLRNTGSSLLAVGVTTVTGRFKRGEVVACVDPAGAEVARGLVNYSAEESQRLKGRPSGEIESILGYVDEPELIGRDNLVITG